MLNGKYGWDQFEQEIGKKSWKYYSNLMVFSMCRNHDNSSSTLISDPGGGQQFVQALSYE